MRKWTLRQFEWYRDNKICSLLPSQTMCLGRFFCAIGPEKGCRAATRNGHLFSMTAESPCLPGADRQRKKSMDEKEIKAMKNRKVKMTAALVLAGMMTLSPMTVMAEEETYTIGIEQFAEHGSLDNCREGFIQGLAEEGLVEGENLTIDYKNAAADMAAAGQISDNFASAGVDLICGIATPSAQSAFNAAMDKEIPVIYTAVTDPVAAELADEEGNAPGEVTGTSDKLPVELQLEMIREMLPEAKTIGILYTTSEANSESAIKEYEALVGEYGFELETAGITATADIPLAAEGLLSKVDCLTNLTDNTVVSSLPTILEMAGEKNIPVFGSEIEQVKIGCLAAEGLDYVALGVQTGKMAAKVLKGEAKASEIPYETIEEAALYINAKAAENLGIEVSEELTDKAAEVYNEITEYTAE